MIKAREKAKAATEELKKHEAAKAKAEKEHGAATKAVASTKDKHEAAKTKASEAEKAVGKAAENVEATKKTEDLKRQARQDKKAQQEEAKKTKDAGKGPGVLSGIKAGFHSGRAAGAAIGAAAARPEGAGGVASSVLNYGTSGAVTMGHFLLNPKAALRSRTLTGRAG